LKKQIVNYYTCTKNFKEKFVDELSNITEEMDQEKEKEELQNYYAKNPNMIIKKSLSKDKEESEATVEKEKVGFMKGIFGGNKKKKSKK
jgi:hypothetical protein